MHSLYYKSRASSKTWGSLGNRNRRLARNPVAWNQEERSRKLRKEPATCPSIFEYMLRDRAPSYLLINFLYCEVIQQVTK